MIPLSEDVARLESRALITRKSPDHPISHLLQRQVADRVHGRAASEPSPGGRPHGQAGSHSQESEVYLDLMAEREAIEAPPSPRATTACSSGS